MTLIPVLELHAGEPVSDELVQPAAVRLARTVPATVFGGICVAAILTGVGRRRGAGVGCSWARVTDVAKFADVRAFGLPRSDARFEGLDLCALRCRARAHFS